MKANSLKSRNSAGLSLCAASGGSRKCASLIREQIGRSKATIFEQAREKLGPQERMLRLALNEAEALAWETRYPLLVFPALASEKVEELTHWSSHQRLVRKADATIALTA